MCDLISIAALRIQRREIMIVRFYEHVPGTVVGFFVVSLPCGEAFGAEWMKPRTLAELETGQVRVAAVGH